MGVSFNLFIICCLLYTIKAASADDVEFHFRFFLLRPPMALVKYYPMGIIGCDKFSCPGNNKILKEKYFLKFDNKFYDDPVSIVSFGNADWKGILKSVNKRDYLRYISYMAETNLAAMRKNSLNKVQPILYQTFIVDMEGISMRQMAYKPCNKFIIFFSNQILLNHFDLFIFF